MRTILKLLVAAAIVTAASGASADEPVVIGYVTKSAANQGWALINKGAEDAAREAKVKLVVGGPGTHGALEDQVNAIELVAAQGIKALVLAPIDSVGVVPVVQRVAARGIPVIAVDTKIEDSSAKSYVATDNVAASAAQAEWVAGQIADQAEVVLVNGDLHQSTGRERRQGFLERLKQLKPDATVYEVNTSWDVEEARIGVEETLKAHPKASVVANAWDDGTLGTITSLRTLGFEQGRVRVIGFDGAPNALALLRSGWIQADVAQMLYRQGYEGVKTAIAVAKGEPVPARIDTGYQVVTPDNLERFIAENKLAEFMQ
ncbi:sugar ABC transporter substrate-binding protein [Microvirga sp. 2TAF3]|uniref:sugar ABC transporter substrate-binding protein n=1 Tax=Microvirga sp. 2TAF3 TaxID=3233014 RepID=UPI003F9ABFAD